MTIRQSAPDAPPLSLKLKSNSDFMEKKGTRSYIGLILLAGLIVLADQLTKWLIVSRMGLFDSIPVIPGFFNITYIHNTGAAFGLLAGSTASWRPYFFIGIALLALGFIAFAFRRFQDRGWFYFFAFGAIAGGAVGNLIDRVRYGSVVDFLDFYVGRYHWPAFNVADTAIVIGVGLFLLANFLEQNDE